MLRPQEIPIYIAESMQDLGITGSDWIKETGADVELIQDLEYASRQWLTLVLISSFIFRNDCNNRSYVWFMLPSSEFSAGTTP